MKRIILLLLLTSVFQRITAQETDGKITVGILPVTATNVDARIYCDRLHGVVTQSFVSKSRFTVVDRSKFDQIARERNFQKQEDFLDGLVIEQGKSLGAQYLVQVNINQFTYQHIQISQPKFVNVNGQLMTKTEMIPAIDITIAATFQMIDVATGQVKNSITPSLSRKYKVSQVDAAVANMFREVPGLVNAWANQVFPVIMKIVKVEETDKRGLPKTVLIKGGADMDLHRGKFKGSILQVYVNDVVLVDGQENTRQLPIGELMADEMQGDFTACKVKDGKEEIQKRLNEGKTLFLRMTKW